MVETASVVLPGSTIGFRIQVINTGGVSLPQVDLGETLTCDPWFLPGTVVADIDGTPADACICPGGCNTIADLNGVKDLTTCVPGGEERRMRVGTSHGEARATACRRTVAAVSPVIVSTRQLNPI